MSNFSIHSFPPIINKNDLAHFSELFINTNFSYDTYKNYSPNLIGITVLLDDVYHVAGICSYNYLCPYNIIATYSDSNNSSIDFFDPLISDGVTNVKNGIAITKTGKKIKHQIIDFLSKDGNNNVGEIIVSGDHLYHQYTDSSNDITIEYLSDGFESISAITNEAFHNTSSIKTVKLPYYLIESFYNSSNGDGLVIGDNAFSASSIEEFYCYHSVKEVGTSAFAHCEKLSGNEISCNGIALVGSQDDASYEIYGTNHNKCNITLVPSNLSGLKVCFDCKENSFEGCSFGGLGIDLYFFDGLDTETSFYNCLSVNVDSFSTSYEETSDRLQLYNTPSTPIPTYYGSGNIKYPKYSIKEKAFYTSKLNHINGYGFNIVASANLSLNYPPFGSEFKEWTSCEYRKVEDDNDKKYVIPRCLDLSSATDAFRGCEISGRLYFEDISENVGIASGAFANNYISGLTNNSGGRIDVNKIEENAFANNNISNQEDELGNIANLDNFSPRYSDKNDAISKIFGNGN